MFNGLVTLMTAVSLLVLASPGARAAGNERGRLAARGEVVDANGLVVGVTAGFNAGGEAYVLVPDGDLVLTVLVARLAWRGPGTLIYDTADCSGQPYILEDALFALPVPTAGVYYPTIGQNDRRVWYATSLSAIPVLYVAAYDDVKGCQLVPWAPDYQPQLAYPAASSQAMQDFEPPFKTRLAR